jgi:hypothetical protein
MAWSAVAVSIESGNRCRVGCRMRLQANAERLRCRVQTAGGVSDVQRESRNDR